MRAWQALAGMLLIVGVTAGTVAGLRMLVQAGQVAAPLDAPAEPTAEDPCERTTPPAGAPVPVGASQLFECPDLFDGRAVVYRGEVVRAVLRRGRRAWLQVNDDPYAMDAGPLPEHRTALGGNSGVADSVPIDVAASITAVGNHRHHGDLIEVEGVFHRADEADGGGPTIQAVTATIQRPGRPIEPPASGRRAGAAAVTTAVALLLAMRRRLARSP